MNANSTSNTKLTSRLVKRLAIISMAVPLLLAKAQNNTGTLVISGTGTNASYSVVTVGGTTWGEYYVDHYERINGLSPRAERYHQNWSPLGAGTKWTGYIWIVKANDTTTFQVLNTDPNRTDTSIPQMFTRAYTDSAGNPSIKLDLGSSLPTIWSGTAGQSVAVKVNSYYRSSDGKTVSDIYMDGSLVYTKTHGQQTGNNKNRYGAYHHGTGAARIRVRNAYCVNN